MSGVATTMQAALDEATRAEAARPAAIAGTPLPTLALTLGLMYGAAALLSLQLGRQPGSVATLWYANALATAVLAFRAPSQWPWLLFAMGVSNLAANVAYGDAPGRALLFLPPNLLEVALAAWALRRSGLVAQGLRSARALLSLLLLGGVLPQVVTATAATLMLLGEGFDHLSGVWLPWFEGSVIGAISMLPLAFLVCRQGVQGLRQQLLDPRLLILLPMAVGVTLLTLAQVPYPFVLLATPLLLAAMVVDLAATLLLTLVASVTIAAAFAGGVFVAPPQRAAWEQVFLYLAIAAALVPAQLLAAARAELDDSHARLAARSLELRHSNDGLEQFVRIASHDLREPLNTIVQFGQLIQEDEAARLSDGGRRYLALVLQAARRMRLLLDDVLQYARLQRSTAAPIHAEPVALAPLFAELSGALAGRIRASGADLRVDLSLAVHGNPTMLSLLFQNLLSNALKFVPPERRPEVYVSERVDGDHVWITVADNGIGIENDDLPKLFQPFQRLQLRRLYEGSGLGLALARQVAEAHGGEIVAASVPGEGSRFSVRLPRA